MKGYAPAYGEDAKGARSPHSLIKVYRGLDYSLIKVYICSNYSLIKVYLYEERDL